MRIYVNGRFLTQRRTGVERYAYELCNALRDMGVRFTLVCPKRPLAPDYDIRGFDIVKYGIGASHFWEQCVLPFYFVGKKDYLLLSFTGLGSILVPHKVMTIHDLSFLHNPKWFSSLYYHYYKLLTPLCVRTSKAVITVSQFSKSEILRFYPFLSPDCIHVIYNACDSSHFSSHRQSGDQQPYALAVSSIDPRKNIDLLVHAFSNPDIGAKLYVVGNHNRVFASTTGRDAPQSENVVFLGRVTDERLSQLYAGAVCYISSSLYEGFGLPLLEAMTSGCPVLCSDIPVYREVCADSAYYFDPESVLSLEQAFACVRNETLAERAALCAAMRRNLERFSWHTSACILVDLISGLQRHTESC